MKQQFSFKRTTFCTAMLVATLGNALYAADIVKVEGGNIRVEFNANMHSRVTALFGGKETVLGPFTASETVTVDGAELANFALSGSSQQNVRDPLGSRPSDHSHRNFRQHPEDRRRHGLRPFSPDGILSRPLHQ